MVHGSRHVRVKLVTGPGMYRLNGAGGSRHVLVSLGAGPGMYWLNGAWVQACMG